jgi:hypothetical protein
LANHPNEDIKVFAKKILRERFHETPKTDPEVAKAIEEKGRSKSYLTDFQSTGSYSCDCLALSLATIYNSVKLLGFRLAVLLFFLFLIILIILNI